MDDDIYLDDQGDIEGSGRGGGEVRDDLEASGSGIGPDDEDGDDGTGRTRAFTYPPILFGKRVSRESHDFDFQVLSEPTSKSDCLALLMEA